MTRSVLVTGASGYLGQLLIESLATDRNGLATVVASDLAVPDTRLAGIEYEAFDIRDPVMADVLRRHHVDCVVHLAAVVSAGRHPDREREHSIDVGGTKNVLESCLAAGVSKIIVSSSGAAYGYHADNPEWLTEEDPLRGNVEFSYSDHKRQVEELLGVWRTEHPELRQLILRPGTILGRGTNNQITALFERPVVVSLRGASTPFVFVWDQDVVNVFRRGITTGVEGIYNVAGDGVMTMREIAALLGKRRVVLPVPVVRGALAILSSLHLTQYGPEQVDFLRYRPVLSNRRLKDRFGYVPAKTSREAWVEFLEGRRESA